MTAAENLETLEALKEFVEKVMPVEILMKNLVLEKVDTPNKRLWALRECAKMDEAAFAQEMGVDSGKYHEYERNGNSVPLDFLAKVARKLSISLDWLLCKCPILPLPIDP